MTRVPVVYALSDSTGETAEQACRAGLAQFGPGDVAHVRLVSHVLDEAGVQEVVERARAEGGLIVHTLARPELRRYLRRIADESGVTAVDLLGVLIREFARHLDRVPLSLPGLGHETDAAYFERIEAVEFAVNNDDGRQPANLRNADIVLVGISRTSKTPLSNYIAQRGYKVANVPIIPGVPHPQELSEVDPRRVFGLVIDPAVLVQIRRTRMSALGISSDTAYADLEHIRREMMDARRLFREHPDWTVIDITRKAVEETASVVLEHYRARFERNDGSEVREGAGG